MTAIGPPLAHTACALLGAVVLAHAIADKPSAGASARTD
jgi:hypothetical protein